MGKVITDSQIESQLGPLRTNKKLVFTNGCFDLLHVGHIRYLQSARALGDALVVGVNSDRSVRELKGEERPLQNEQDRAEILASLGCVDYVVVFDTETPLELIKKVKPKVLAKGGDWKPENIVGGKEVLGWGGEVKSLQFVEGRSTSNLVEKIKRL